MPINRFSNEGNIPKKHIMFTKWAHPITTLNTENNDENDEYDQNLDIKKNIVVDILGLSDFKFYMGHTDFQITKAIVDIIDDIEGVESLTVFTPYRMRVSVGKLFDDNIVLGNIKKKISNYLNYRNA